MRKDFVNEVAKQNRIEQTDLIEKDLILHQILTDLAQRARQARARVPLLIEFVPKNVI